MRLRLTALFFAFLCLALSAKAQESAYDTFAGVYHPYICRASVSTPAPKGYVPFYISHVGRHGSRYAVDRDYILNGLEPLEKADSAGILTEDGKLLLDAFRRLDKLSDGVYGMLCEQGYAEHAGIARRMLKAYPQVFKNKHRDSVFVQSTYRQRCLQSSFSFCLELKGAFPALRFGQVAGDKYYDILSNAELPEIKANNKIGGKKANKILQQKADLDAYYEKLFTDQKKALEVAPVRRLMAETVYANGAMADYLGIPELRLLMSLHEYEAAARTYNAKMFYQHCGSAEVGAWRMRFSRPLLSDFLERADAAVAGNELAADLRFSHDTGMMPFFSLIGLKGFDVPYTFEQAYEQYDATTLMCMATNLQLIFYKNKKGDVLVKILHNEAESSIPALGPGPYYSWDVLREHFVKCLAK